VIALDGTPVGSLEGVRPVLTYYPSDASSSPLARAPRDVEPMWFRLSSQAAPITPAEAP